MKGYLKNAAATAEAFAGDWYHTGDLAVMYEDGYCEVKDRSKDIIISGGENISSIEVEGALYRHPAVLEAAVVARPDAKWGEAPCASSRSSPAPRHRAGPDRPLPRAPRRVQVPRRRGLRRAAEDLHRQDPKARPARSGQGAVRRRHAPGCPRGVPYVARDQALLANESRQPPSYARASGVQHQRRQHFAQASATQIIGGSRPWP